MSKILHLQKGSTDPQVRHAYANSDYMVRLLSLPLAEISAARQHKAQRPGRAILPVVPETVVAAAIVAAVARRAVGEMLGQV
jgi:hypothetical protein